eukprot:scaffold2155_cov260-Pinguiococcus_pyrenoidosus.AAC.1
MPEVTPAAPDPSPAAPATPGPTRRPLARTTPSPRRRCTQVGSGGGGGDARQAADGGSLGAGLRRRHVEQQNGLLEEQMLRHSQETARRIDRHGHHDSDSEDEQHEKAAVRVILESSTESNVESLVEIGAITCMSGRLPGVSIFYALLLFVVVALASSVSILLLGSDSRVYPTPNPPKEKQS